MLNKYIHILLTLPLSFSRTRDLPPAVYTSFVAAAPHGQRQPRDQCSRPCQGERWREREEGKKEPRGLKASSCLYSPVAI